MRPLSFLTLILPCSRGCRHDGYSSTRARASRWTLTPCRPSRTHTRRRSTINLRHRGWISSAGRLPDAYHMAVGWWRRCKASKPASCPIKPLIRGNWRRLQEGISVCRPSSKMRRSGHPILVSAGPGAECHPSYDK